MNTSNSKKTKSYDQLLKERDCLAIELFFMKAKYEVNSFWSFDKIRQEYKDANVPFTYRESDTPKGYYIKEYPDGTKEMFKFKSSNV